MMDNTRIQPRLTRFIDIGGEHHLEYASTILCMSLFPLDLSFFSL